MDGRTLMNSMAGEYPPPLSLSRYEQLAPGATEALQRANCTTVRRASAFLAQIGAESGSLRWTEELASGEEYNWRADLGNTVAGDGPRYKGRTFIQVTGRHNYGQLSKWAHAHGYCPSADYFIDHPAQLASDTYVWLGPVWYWTVARPQINNLADAGDIDAVTYAVNGGYNNATGRAERWRHCLTLGDALLIHDHIDPMEEILSYYKNRDDFENHMRAIVDERVKHYATGTNTKLDHFSAQTAHSDAATLAAVKALRPKPHA